MTEWRLIAWAYDLIRHRVQFHYWPGNGLRYYIVPTAAREALLWLASRT